MTADTGQTDSGMEILSMSLYLNIKTMATLNKNNLFSAFIGNSTN
jgi:hypothetical protein